MVTRWGKGHALDGGSSDCAGGGGGGGEREG